MTRPAVLLRRATYEYEPLKKIVFEAADFFLKDSIGPGSLVLIKPNLLAPAGPERAIVTHPHIIRATAEYALSKGARVRISDSPAMGRFDRLLRETGIGRALEGLDVEIVEFRESEVVEVGEPFNRIELAQDAVRAETVINLPKLKTHTQMLLTLGVKNLFGCVVGLRKPEWHLRTGVNRDLFAALLVKIHEAIRPSLTLLDGITAMEGEGPGRSGIPRHLGIIAASDNAFALDAAISGILGLEPMALLTNRAAERAGVFPGIPELNGEPPEIKDFLFPEPGPLVFGPDSLQPLMRRHFVQRPVPEGALCRQCGECWKYCPAKAIGPGRRGVKIDYEKCIRCFCCAEVCPHGALKIGEPLLGKLLRKLGKY